MDDVVTIRISRHAIRVFLLILAAFVIVGVAVPVVLIGTTHSHGPSSGHAQPVQTP